jgi:heme/copper-type cytochrome/quinol oxidase subunit 2
MLNTFLFIIAIVGGVIGVYFIFHRLQEEDKAIIKKHKDIANREFYRQMWLGGIVRHSIFALCTIAAGGGIAMVNMNLDQAESSSFGVEYYYLSAALILIGIFWLIIVAVKYARENKEWQKPSDEA